jgi:O-antigen/teichoic acid export membrane protein
MAPFRFPSTGLPRQLAFILRTSLSLEGLKRLITHSSADRGRERYRRAGVTASTSYIARGLAILTGFVSVPLTVSYLGAERYGIWLTISSVLVWLALMDFGLAGSALVNVLSEAAANDDRAAARQYTASAFWALVTIALVIGVSFVAAFHLIPWRAVFRVSDAISTQELELTCALVLTLFIINLPLSLLRGIYNGHQEGYLANVWWIVGGVISLLSLVVVTRFQGGLPQLVIALSGVPALVVFVSAYHVFVRRYPWLAPAPSAAKWTCIRRLLKLGGKYTTIQLAALGIYQSQAMIITQVLGPSQVVIFVVAFKVITLPVELTYMGTVPFIAPLGEAKALHDWRWIKGAFKTATVASVALGVPLAAVLAFVAKPLILFWAGPSAVPDSNLILWLFMYTVLGVSVMMTGQLLSGIGRIETLLLSVVLCSFSCVVLGVLFASWWGLSGVAFAMAISMLVILLPIRAREVRRIFRTGSSA